MNQGEDVPILSELFMPQTPEHDNPLSPAPAARRASIELHLVCVSLVFIACVALGFLLIFLQPVLKPLVFACFLSYLLSPFVELLTTPWSPRSLAARFTGDRTPPHKPERVLDEEEASFVIGTQRPRSSSRTRAMRSAAGPIGAGPSGAGTVACPHSVAVLVVLTLTAVTIVIFVNLVVNSVASLEEKFPKYKAQAIEMVAFARTALGKDTALSKALKSVHHSLGGPVELSAVPAAWLARWIQELPITSYLVTFAQTVLASLETTAVVLLFSVFIMMGADAGHGQAGQGGAAEAQRSGGSGGGLLSSAAGGGAVSSLGEKIDAQVRQYIVLKSALSLLVAVSVGLTLSLLSVDLAFLFATVSFFANFVPNVGMVVATLLPLPVALLDPEQSWMGCSLALLIPLGIHLLVGSVLEPKVFGMGLALHPVVVLFTVLLWALLWGIGGMVVSVPLTAVLRIVLKEIKHPYAVLAVGIFEGRFMPSNAPGSRRGRSTSRDSSFEP